MLGRCFLQAPYIGLNIGIGVEHFIRASGEIENECIRTRCDGRCFGKISSGLLRRLDFLLFWIIRYLC